MNGLARQFSRVGRLGAHQSVGYTAAAGTVADAIGAGVTRVRVVVTTAAYVRIGSGDASTADPFMPAGKPEDFVATQGERVSAVQVADPGTLHVTEISDN